MVDNNEDSKEDKKEKILQVRSDTLFHDLFNENDITTLEWVVSKILDVEYKVIKGKVSVLNSRLTRVNKKERNKYVDLIVEYKQEKIIIELNNNFKGVYTRNILYATNILLNNYKINDDLNMNDDYYKKVVRVLLVNLNWYQGSKGKNIPSKKIYEIPYSDLPSSGYLLKIVNVNLDSYKDICYDKVESLDKFYKLLTINNKDDLNEVIKDEKLLKNYSNKLIDFSSNKKYEEDIMDEIIEINVAKQTGYLEGLEEGREVGLEQGREEGIQQGIQQGIEQGSLETKKELVINMYNQNYNIEDIVSITNLTSVEVKNIIKEDNN